MKVQKKILAVDDNPDNTTIIEELFYEDYDLRTAATGEEALKIAIDFQPDLILLDIILPDMDGYEVCRRLKALLAFPYEDHHGNGQRNIKGQSYRL